MSLTPEEKRQLTLTIRDYHKAVDQLYGVPGTTRAQRHLSRRIDEIQAVLDDMNASCDIYKKIRG